LAALLRFGQPPYTWAALKEVRDFGRREAWEEQRVALGRAMHADVYMTLAAAYRGLADAKARAAEVAGDAVPSDEEGFAVGSTYLTTNQSFFYLSLLLHMPPIWKPRARRALRREVSAQVANLRGQDRNYRAFRVKYGRGREASG
jgi:hypothetical protein